MTHYWLQFWLVLCVPGKGHQNYCRFWSKHTKDNKAWDLFLDCDKLQHKRTTSMSPIIHAKCQWCESWKALAFLHINKSIWQNGGVHLYRLVDVFIGQKSLSVLYLPNWEEPNKNADWEIFVATQNRQMKGGRAKTNSKRRKEEGDKQNQNWPQHYLHG